MTDREIYARVYAACINGIMSTTRNVNLEWDGERVGMSVFCHKLAMNAVASAPKEDTNIDETDIDDFPEHDIPAVVAKAYGLKIETADENKKEQDE